MICRQQNSVILAVTAFLLAFLLVKPVFPVTIGNEFPIATTAVREMSVSVAFDGTNYLVGIQGDAFAHYNISGQLVSQSGTLVGSLISPGRTGGVPAVAFDGTNYLMVWEDDENHPNDDIYAQLVSASGALVGPAFPISQATGRQADNGVAFDGTNYLIIWEDRRNDIDGDMECDIGEGTCIDIYGQLVSPSGTLVGPEIAISKASQNQLCPSLAFDGTNYLVVWQDYRNENGAETFGQFITKSGALSGSSFVISETPSPRYNPLGITFDGTNYLVVWNRDIGSGYPNPSIWDIYGRIVTPLGSFLGPEFPISVAPRDQGGVFAAFDGTNYLVTWTDARNDINDNWICDPGEGTCADIYGHVISPAGTLVGSEFPIIQAEGNQAGSALAFDGANFIVVWNTGGILFDDTSNWDVYGVFVTVAPPCECDLTHDGRCDMEDWLLFGEDWGRTDCHEPSVECECDLNDDGGCDMLDWLLFGEDWGRTDCP